MVLIFEGISLDLAKQCIEDYSILWILQQRNNLIREFECISDAEKYLVDRFNMKRMFITINHTRYKIDTHEVCDFIYLNKHVCFMVEY